MADTLIKQGVPVETIVASFQADEVSITRIYAYSIARRSERSIERNIFSS